MRLRPILWDFKQRRAMCVIYNHGRRVCAFIHWMSFSTLEQNGIRVPKEAA